MSSIVETVSCSSQSLQFSVVDSLVGALVSSLVGLSGGLLVGSLVGLSGGSLVGSLVGLSGGSLVGSLVGLSVARWSARYLVCRLARLLSCHYTRCRSSCPLIHGH